MYENIKTRVFCDGVKSEPFYCQLGVRQGECLSPFLFAMYINDLEMYLSANNSGITASHMKMFLLLYADDIVIFADSAEELQSVSSGEGMAAGSGTSLTILLPAD